MALGRARAFPTSVSRPLAFAVAEQGLLGLAREGDHGCTLGEGGASSYDRVKAATVPVTKR